MTVLHGPLKIVARAHLGESGQVESEPVFVEWRWHEHLPAFAGWAMLVALLVFVKENRNRSAWLILIPFFLLSEVIWPWTVRLFSLSTSLELRFGLPYQMVLTFWTALWLVSPWLARRRPPVALACALGLGAIVGVATLTGALHRLPSVETLLTYATHVFALPVACALSAICCRGKYRPRRFMAWLGVWLVVAVVAGESSRDVHRWLSFPQAWGPLGPPILKLVLRIAVLSLPIAVVLYLLNLPFMYLAFHCPAYRDRFHRILRLPECQEPASEVPASV